MHIIGEHQGTSDLPEHRHMKGVDGGYTGEKGVTLDQRARGMGGLQTSCGEENLLDLDSDPRYTHARTHVHARARAHAHDMHMCMCMCMHMCMCMSQHVTCACHNM